MFITVVIFTSLWEREEGCQTRKENLRALSCVWKDKSTPYVVLLNRMKLHTFGKSYNKGHDSDCSLILRKLLTIRKSENNLRGYHLLKLPKVLTKKYGLKHGVTMLPNNGMALPNDIRALKQRISFRDTICKRHFSSRSLFDSY